VRSSSSSNIAARSSAGALNTSSKKAKEREHILNGLLKAIDILDQVIASIRAADSAANALEILQGTVPVPAAVATLLRQRQTALVAFDFSDVQSRAILDMQLRRLAALERKALQDEYEELIKKIAYLEDPPCQPAQNRLPHQGRPD